MTFDWTINLGQVGAFAGFLFVLAVGWGAAKSRLDDLQIDVVGIQAEFKKLTDIMIANSARDVRIESLANRIDRLERLAERRPLRKEDSNG